MQSLIALNCINPSKYLTGYLFKQVTGNKILHYMVSNTTTYKRLCFLLHLDFMTYTTIHCASTLDFALWIMCLCKCMYRVCMCVCTGVTRLTVYETVNKCEFCVVIITKKNLDQDFSPGFRHGSCHAFVLHFKPWNAD